MTNQRGFIKGRRDFSAGRRDFIKGGVALAAVGGLEMGGPASAVAASAPNPGFGYGDPVRPFNQSWIGQEMPPNIVLDPNWQAVANEIAAQAKISRPTVNIDGRWSGEPYTVAADAPTVPVTCNQDSRISAVLRLGVPIPADFVPASSGEPTLCIYQPTYLSKYGAVSRYFELYKVAQNSAGAWSCSAACRYWNVNGDAHAHSYVWTGGPGGAAYATDPDSTYTANPFIMGSGLPYAPLVLSMADVKRGFVDHALCLALVHSYGRVWPATRSDGATSWSLIREGDRLRLDPTYQIPSIVHPLQRLILQAGQTHGYVVGDMSGCNAFRVAPSVGAAGYLGSTPAYAVLDGFPWDRLQRVKVGSDGNQNPTS